jgi:hypothetical protein
LYFFVAFDSWLEYIIGDAKASGISSTTSHGFLPD